MLIPTRVTERALSRRVPEGHCLVTTYSLTEGYGQIGWSKGGKAHRTLVHRVVWIHYRGPVPEGYEVDHICRNRRCSRLSHLRLLTVAENHAQGQSRKKHCPQGHPYVEGNMVRNTRRSRECLTCKRASYYRKLVA